MPVLDTNFLIRLDHDDARAREALARIEDQILVVPFQAALEYAAGTPNPEAAILGVAGAFVLDRPESATLQAAARLVANVRQKGLRTQSGDAWIAAASLVRQDYVVSANKRHFKQMGVPAWNYMRERVPPG